MIVYNKLAVSPIILMFVGESECDLNNAGEKTLSSQVENTRIIRPYKLVYNTLFLPMFCI